jgi:hypothetical protein
MQVGCVALDLGPGPHPFFMLLSGTAEFLVQLMLVDDRLA